MNRTIQLACLILSAFAILILISEANGQKATGKLVDLSKPNRVQPIQNSFDAMMEDLRLARRGRLPNAELTRIRNPHVAQQEQAVSDSLEFEIPEGFCLVGMRLDANASTAPDIKPGQTVDLYFVGQQPLNANQVKRLISDATVYSVNDNRGAPFSKVTLLLKRDFVASFLHSQRWGVIEPVIVKQQFDRNRLSKQSLEWNPFKNDQTSIADSSSEPVENESIEQIKMFRSRVGSRVRDTLSEIQKMTGDEGDASALDKAFQQRLEQLFKNQGEMKNEQSPKIPGSVPRRK